MSVDETDTPTSIHEHFFIASELREVDLNATVEEALNLAEQIGEPALAETQAQMIERYKAEL